MLPPRHDSDSQLWYAGRNSGSAAQSVLGIHTNGVAPNARVRQRDAELPRNCPDQRAAPSWRGPGGSDPPEPTIR